ncbi:MAG: DNA-binding protein [Butyrivibrio sp.]|nr:DNA-binding protein [Butyrivibrio sp.]
MADDIKEVVSRTIKLPIGEKYMLTLKEASAYFNIGEKKMRKLAEDNLGEISIFSGNKYLIIRTKFEKFLNVTNEI